MSYDLYFKLNDETVILEQPLDIRGGTYAVGGTSEAWLNITWNYSGVFTELFGEGGIRTLYGKDAPTVAVDLTRALDTLSRMELTEVPCTCEKSAAVLGYSHKAPHYPLSCYWAVTRANVREALLNLWRLAHAVPAEAMLTGD